MPLAQYFQPFSTYNVHSFIGLHNASYIAMNTYLILLDWKDFPYRKIAANFLNSIEKRSKGSNGVKNAFDEHLFDWNLI